jgi:predicted aspartyl protease
LESTNAGPYNDFQPLKGAPTMTTTEKAEMGRVVQEVELVNHQDSVLAGVGVLAADKVRRLRIEGIVDTGASHLVIPKTAADALGVPVIGETGVRYADRRRAARQIVDDVEVHLLSRSGTFKAIIEPDRENVLIGAIILEDMDLIVDCREQKLVPRDPDRILSEIE